MFSGGNVNGGNGCGCGTDSNNGSSGNIWSNSGLKKQQKRPKVPKRGPGVAELEKILREQEKTDRGNNNNGEGFSVSHHSPPPPLKPHCSPPSPPPPSLPALTSPPTHIQMAPRFDHYGYNTTSLGRNSNLVFPEQALFPMNPSSSDGYTQSDHSANSSISKNLSSESNNPPLWSSYPALPPKRHNHNNNSSQYSPTMMKQFLGPGTPNSSSALQTGLYNQVAEPPSNQSSYFDNVSWSGNPEEHKMVGMKRPHPSSFDNSFVPPTTHFQVSPMFSNFTRPHKSSTNDHINHVNASSFTSSSNSDYFYRDAKYWGSISSPLGYNCRKLNSENNGGPCHPKFLSFNAPAATLPSQSQHIHMFQREFCKSDMLPNQISEDRMEDSYQRSESSSGSDHHRTFYSFLEVAEEGKKETTLGSKLEGCESGNDGIDLSLKL